MVTNVEDSSSQSNPRVDINGSKENNAPRSQPVPFREGSYTLIIFQSSLNLLSHILIGSVVGISLIYSFQNGLPLGATQLHIVLCVIGYQLLMAEAILSLSPHNTWSWNMKLIDKRRAHWILQLGGASLAIAGSTIKIINKTVHWNTLHGKFALVALIFTVISLINGFTSLWAYEFRRFIPGNLSKLTHICFGAVAFTTSSVALCYGFEKNMFRLWLSNEIAYTLMALTATFTLLIIIDPIISFCTKTKNVLKK